MVSRTMDSLGLYLSVPFCRSKCSYCNFASGVYPASSFPRYVERLIENMQQSATWAASHEAVLPRRVDSIYFGGGTPSILPPELLKGIFRSIREHYSVASTAEITIECAPGQLNDAALETMVECGVNRISFGVQSFIDREAAVTGRLHNREIALRDIERVKEAGIASVNVDLIAGLPYQTTSSWHESLDTLASVGANHASIYMLEVDEDSRLGRELLAEGGKYHAGSVPSEDAMADMYLAAIEFLKGQGIAQYEISNFAKAGSESRHNLKYWQRQPYLGLGVDAHSMIRGADGHAIRLSTSDDLNEYLAAPLDPVLLHLSEVEELEEEWFLGLRLSRGVNVASLTRRYGREAIVAIRPVLNILLADGLLEKDGARVRLSSRGRMISNDVFGRFLQASPAVEFDHDLISVR